MKLGAIVLCLSAISISSARSGFVEQSTSKAAPRAPDYCRLADVVGANVTISPNAEAVDDATKNGEIAKRQIGKVSGLLLDSCNGEERWAIITFDKTHGSGGKTVAVPCNQLTWNREQNCFSLLQSDERLGALPNFDLEAARKAGFDPYCSELHPYWPTSFVDPHHTGSSASSDRNLAEGRGKLDGESTRDERTAFDCPALEVDGKLFACAPPQLLLAADLQNRELYGRGELFGRIGESIVDRANGAVRYYVVNHGGKLGIGATKFLIPVRAIWLHKNGSEFAYSSDRSLAELEAGVKYTAPPDGVLDLDLARRADEWFSKDIEKRGRMIHP